MSTFLETLRERPLLFDGAIGTELYHRGVFLTSNFEELCLTRPALVLEVHRDYREAGAQVLTTNSYGANRFRLERFGLGDKVVEINRAAAELARAGAGHRAWVAGSVGPSGLEPAGFLGSDVALRASLEEQIAALVDGGAQLLLLETFAHLAEMKVAMEVARSVAPDLPLLATLRFEDNERLIDGSAPEDVATALKHWGADVIGVNCGEGPELVFRVARRMLEVGVPLLAQPNAGTPSGLEGRTIYVGNPEYFGVYGRRMLKAGIQALGGCCGTTPDHIQRMQGAIRMMGGVDVRTDEPQIEVRDRAAEPGTQRVPAAERSSFARKLSEGRFVVSVEVNPPHGLDPTPAVEAARQLRDAGVDVINIADGPRASVRMNNLALALRIQHELDMEALLHVCCRDRNLLGLQADLLGAHVLGIRNLVVITGDPPKMGDYPDATAVYDVDSLGLLRMVDGYNQGLDPAGKRMPEPTRFHVATGAEPGALDYDREIARLEAKRDAGADLVMTQPVYDPRTVERFLDDTAHLGLPVLLGLLPLASHRNAEFLHTQVPGMSVPADIRARMKAAGGGQKARDEGVKIAQETLEAMAGRIQGVYIMPPLGHYEMAPRILEVLGDRDRRGGVA